MSAEYTTNDFIEFIFGIQNKKYINIIMKHNAYNLNL